MLAERLLPDLRQIPHRHAGKVPPGQTLVREIRTIRVGFERDAVGANAHRTMWRGRLYQNRDSAVGESDLALVVSDERTELHAQHAGQLGERQQTDVELAAFEAGDDERSKFAANASCS